MYIPSFTRRVGLEAELYLRKVEHITSVHIRQRPADSDHHHRVLRRVLPPRVPNGIILAVPPMRVRETVLTYSYRVSEETTGTGGRQRS